MIGIDAQLVRVGPIKLAIRRKVVLGISVERFLRISVRQI